MILLVLIGLFGPAALVWPGVKARQQGWLPLLSVVLGTFWCGAVLIGGVLDALDRNGAKFLSRMDSLGFIMIGWYGTILVTGCYGVWRWFKLPRR